MNETNAQTIRLHGYLYSEDVKKLYALINDLRKTDIGKIPVGRVVGAILKTFIQNKEYVKKVKELL